MLTPQFTSVGEGNLDLQTLVAVGEDCPDKVQIQTLDAFGRTVDSYDWNDWIEATPCWANGDFEKVENVSLAPGQGVWVAGAGESQAIQSAGRVCSADVVVRLRAGATGTGNPFPIAIDLQDILAEGEDCPDKVQIQTLDAFGRTVDSYDWNDWIDTTPCWANGDFEKVENVVIAPGQGLWVAGANEDQFLRFPAPEF